MIVQYIKVLTSLWAFAHCNTSRGKKEGQGGKKNTWYQFWSDGVRRARICRVIEMLSSASLPPQQHTQRMSHICMGGRNVGQSESRYCKPFISKARPLVDLVRQPIRVLSSILLGWFAPSFALCAAPCSVCLSLSSQWPILHHRWGRQKGETTARLLFGETRSVQLSERRGREGQREREREERTEWENVIYLHIADGEKKREL